MTEKGYEFRSLTHNTHLKHPTRYSLKDGTTFAEQASHLTLDLTTDEGLPAFTRHHASAQLKWDRKKKKFVKGNGEGADNVKIVKTESGTRLPATYRSGRFDEWKARMRVSVPRVGEKEVQGGTGERNRGGPGGGKRFKHQKVTPAKPLDKIGRAHV